jgi:hypothetical protein
MNYEIKGQIKLSTDIDFTTHSTYYADYNDAVDNYILTYGGVAKDIAQLGGEFVISLIQWNDNSTFVMLKRHTLNTTINND